MNTRRLLYTAALACSTALISASAATVAVADTPDDHGGSSVVQGATGVKTGLGVLDGTPRDCIVNACGAQADTGIIRDEEIDRGK